VNLPHQTSDKSDVVRTKLL